MTGFGSYAAYLHDVADGIVPASHFEHFMEDFNDDDDDDDDFSSQAKKPCANIIEVSKDELSEAKVHSTHENLSASQTYHALREYPPQGTKVRVVLWTVGVWHISSRNFVNLFGLIFGLDPVFFDFYEYSSDFMSREIESKSQSSFGLEDLRVKVHMARSSVISQSSSVPVLLVDGDLDEALSHFYSKSFHSNLLARTFIFGSALPFNTGVKELMLNNSFIEALSTFLKKNKRLISRDEEVMIACILCFVDLNMISFREAYWKIRGDFKRRMRKLNRYLTSLYGSGEVSEIDFPICLYHWFGILRAHIENHKAQEVMTRRIISMIGDFASEAPLYVMFTDYAAGVIDSAQELDKNIRDYVQVDSSRLAILESRKPIQLSDNQIEEGKRGQ